MADHSVVHIEIPAVNTQTTSKFYGDVFGWRITKDQMYDYTTFDSTGGTRGGFVDLSGEAPIEYKADKLLIYLGTDDIEATLATIEANGGKTVLPKTQIPGIGWWAVFTDPSGNQLGLFTGVGQDA